MLSRDVFKTFFILCGLLVVLSGCMYNDEPMPKIAGNYTPAEKIILPPLPPGKPQTRSNVDINRCWLPKSSAERKWTAIVIHHSGTRNGNAAIFDKWHREGRHWEGIGYDFVIGNGTDSPNGQVEVTYRWTEQKAGAHCGGTPGNWANEQAVGICLVGNFNQTIPTQRQMQSLTKLVRFLQNRYKIPKSRIYDHGTTPGAHKTDCPGKNFPMARLKTMLDF